MIEANQIRAARSLLDWSQKILRTLQVSDFQQFKGWSGLKLASSLVSTAEKLNEAFESAGVVFIDAGPDGGPGVRLSK